LEVTAFGAVTSAKVQNRIAIKGQRKNFDAFGAKSNQRKDNAAVYQIIS
jgi:hypothetical protein